MHLRASFPELIPLLQPYAPRWEEIVPRLAAALLPVLGALNEKLASGDEAYADRFLERAAAQPGQGLDMRVEAAEAAPPFEWLAWHPFHKGALRFQAPRARDYAIPRHALAPMIEALGADEATLAAAAADAGAGDDDASEWEGIATPSQSAASVAGGWASGWRAEPAREAASVGPPERMPKAFDEPRALFAKTPPYVLQVTTERSERSLKPEKIVVACSHARTLEVLRDYLQRYLRLDQTTSNRVCASALPPRCRR